MKTAPIRPETLFQAISDETRIRIVILLAESNDEACLCELVDALLLPEYKLSRHLKVLKKVGFIETEKVGKWVYHRLVKNQRFLKLLYESMKSFKETNSMFSKDFKRFQKRMKLREKGRCQVGIQTPNLSKA